MNLGKEAKKLGVGRVEEEVVVEVVEDILGRFDVVCRL